jgi:hypothetical protein
VFFSLTLISSTAVLPASFVATALTLTFASPVFPSFLLSFSTCLGSPWTWVRSPATSSNGYSGSHFYAWREVRAQAGLRHVRWHDWRHFCTTQLLELGIDHFAVSIQLGHTDGGALVMEVRAPVAARRSGAATRRLQLRGSLKW